MSLPLLGTLSTRKGWDMSSRKVYCEDCKYMRTGFMGGKLCAASTEVRSTPIKREVYYDSCLSLNRNNDCKLYRDRWLVIAMVKEIMRK